MKQTERVKRSEEMTREEFVAFLKWVNRFPTKVDCSEALDVTRMTLDNLINKGSGKPETIAKIREQISQIA